MKLISISPATNATCLSSEDTGLPKHHYYCQQVQPVYGPRTTCDNRQNPVLLPLSTSPLLSVLYNPLGPRGVQPVRCRKIICRAIPTWTRPPPPETRPGRGLVLCAFLLARVRPSRPPSRGLRVSVCCWWLQVQRCLVARSRPRLFCGPTLVYSQP